MNHKEMERWYRLKKIQTAAQVMVVLAVVLIIIGYAVSKFTREPAETFSSTTPGSGMLIENFAYSSPGIHNWELKAASAIVSDAFNNVDLTDPKVLYKGGKGGVISLTAENGKLDKNSKKVSAEGNVKVAYREFSFFTGQIDYFDDKKIAESPSDVSLDGGDLKVTGKGLKFSIDKEEVVIEHNVKASISNVELFRKKKTPL